MIEIENAILGTIMTYKDLQDVIVNSLDEKLFYNENNRIIFKTISNLVYENNPADMLTVLNALTKKDQQKIGGAYYISSLTSTVGSGFDYENNIKLLKQEYIKRELVKLYQKELFELLENSCDIAESYSNVSATLEELFSIRKTNIDNIYDVLSIRISEIEKIKQNEITGISTGFNSLNYFTGGWQKSDMIILAARPSMGKTIISNLFSKHPAINGKSVLYFSLEMPKERIADRIVSLDTGINTKKLQQNNLRPDEWASIDANINNYKNKRLLINDQSALTIEEIISISILESNKNKLDLIIIDYLQLIKFSKKTGTTNDQVTHISKNIKNLAKKVNVPVIALSQLSRGLESRTDKRPMLSDLRDSGSIEQDADLVIFIYRDDYYFDIPENKNKIELIIRKNRNGELGIVNLFRNDNWSSIRDSEILEIPDFEEQKPTF